MIDLHCHTTVSDGLMAPSDQPEAESNNIQWFFGDRSRKEGPGAGGRRLCQEALHSGKDWYGDQERAFVAHIEKKNDREAC
jgi:hypothetical protein